MTPADVLDAAGQWPREFAGYETSDGMIHRSHAAAVWRQNQINGAVKANELLAAGASVGAALRDAGLMPAGCYPGLDEVFATTDLIISHWQCRDTPGYRPVRIESDGGVFVHGDAGSWTGPYGSVCTPADVERYWLDTKRRMESAARWREEHEG